MIELIYAFVVIFFILIMVSCLIHEVKTGIPPSPVMPRVRRAVMELANQHTDKDKSYQIADLGSGWGGMLTAFASKFPNAKVTGYEISPWPLFFSRVRKTRFTAGRIEILKKDFFKEDISHFDIVYCYLSPIYLNRVSEQLLRLKPGSIVISASFPIDGWSPVETRTIRGIVKIPVYLYVI